MSSSLHTELIGRGRPRFAFLHGLFGRGRNWTRIARALADAGYPGVLFDLPNHGASPWTTEFRYSQMADAVAEEIDLKLGSAAELVVVGHSMGGKVAMLLALTRPEMVAGLAVVDIAPAHSGQVQTFTPLIAAMREIDLTALTSRDQAEAALAPGVPDPDLRQFLLQNLRSSGGWHWQVNLALLADSLPGVADWPDPQGRFTGPVVWLAGERSDYVRPEHTEEMGRLFPAVTKVVVPDAGHWLHSDKPEVVIAALIDLVVKVDAAARPGSGNAITR